MHKQYNLAVVDAGGNWLAFQRMDGAWLGSLELAINKAYTARSFMAFKPNRASSCLRAAFRSNAMVL